MLSTIRGRWVFRFLARPLGFCLLGYVCLTVFFVLRNGKENVSFSIFPALIVAVKGNDYSINSIIYAEDLGDVSGITFENLPNKTWTFDSNRKEFLANVIQPNNDAGKGLINIYLWTDICGIDISSLKTYPLFPSDPSIRYHVGALELKSVQSDTGLRIFGYIKPKQNGTYQFQIKSLGFTELWLNITDQHLTLLINGSGLSNEIYLHSNISYYFECLHVQGTQDGLLQILWKMRHQRKFIAIKTDELQLYLNDLKLPNHGVVLKDDIIQLQHLQQSIPDSIVDKLIKTMLKLPFLHSSVTKDLFPTCPYNPDYLVRHKLRRYGAVWETHYTAVYPSDDTNIAFHLENTGTQPIFGNDVIDENRATGIASLAMRAIDEKYPGMYRLIQILNIEENNEQHSSRFLVELQLREMFGEKRHVRFSEYVILKEKVLTLCYPDNFKWKKDVDVNVILTVAGRQGRWVKHLINQLSDIAEATNDNKFNVIVVDFNSKDIDIEDALKKSAIPSYMLLRKGNTFRKTEAIQEAISAVRDKNSIVLQVDLHFIFPINFFDSVRKHCIEGKVAYSPLVCRLQCGATPMHPFGYWEVDGYGVFGVYKSDWKKFGGMNLREFHNKWGGEDWEMLDRVLMAGYEVERLKIRGFYHVYHSKKGMWDKLPSV